MVFDDLRGFLKQCEKDGDLEKVDGADWNLEVGTISELAAELGTLYPYGVKFHSRAEAVLVLRNDGDQAQELSLRAHGRIDDRAELAPGATSRFNVPPGAYELTFGTRTAVFVAEPYTEVEIPL